MASELRQAMEELLHPSPPQPTQTCVTCPSESLSAEPVPAQAISPTGLAMIPASSKVIQFSLLLGNGSFGPKCLVKANHFITRLPDKDLHHYDVSITTDVTSLVVSRAVINKLVNLHRASYLGGKSRNQFGSIYWTFFESQLHCRDQSAIRYSEKQQRI